MIRMSTSARFRVENIILRDGQEGGQVNLSADIHADNGEWAKYTPSGTISMNVNGPAFPWFEERVGTTISVTFNDVH